jgi:hypothetical protein
LLPPAAPLYVCAVNNRVRLKPITKYRYAMKKVCLLTLVMAILSAAQLYGQVSFSDIKFIDTTQYFSGTTEYMVDMDGDQDADLLTSGSDDLTVTWYEQDADHNFVQKHIILHYSYDNYIITIAAADMDYDGDIDLAVVQLGSATKISWYENDGAGNYSNNHVIGVVLYNCYQISINDLDRDGDKDIILLNGTTGTEINWFENYGSNHFGPSVNLITEAKGFRSFKIADLDGIDNLEVMYTVRTNTTGDWYSLHCAKKDATGIYSTTQILSDSIHLYVEITVVDWNHDNILDIQTVKGADQDYEVIWFKNDGNAHFEHAISFPVTGEYFKPVIGDYDGDGDNDLAVLISYQGDIKTITLFSNNGPGIPPSSKILPTYSNSNVHLCASNDDDGDQYFDIIIATSEKIIRFKNNGNGLFDKGTTISYDGPLFYKSRMADMDGDGKKDIVSAKGTESSWYKNLGNGQFAPKIGIIGDTFTLTVTLTVESFFADLDNDNDLDMVRVTGKTNWFENDGSNHYSFVKTLNSGIQPQFTTLTDYDGDGDIDLLYYVRTTILGNTTGAINAYRNNGAGVFIGVQLINLGALEINQFNLADLDGDQKLDIYYRDNNNTVIWYKNDGAGHFVNENVVGITVSDITAIRAADMDHDGDVDLCFGAYYEPSFYLYKNDGLGNFEDAGSQTFDLTYYYAHSFILADFDNDGDPDVVVGNAYEDEDGNGGGIWVFENSGDGTLITKTKIFNPVSPYLFVDDLDSDGDLDITWQDIYPIKLGWLENRTIVGTKAPAPEHNIISLAPNPASDETTMTIEKSNLSDPYLIEIQDINGVIVQINKSQGPALKIQRNNLPAGAYYVRVREAKSGKLLGVEQLIWN